MAFFESQVIVADDTVKTLTVPSTGWVSGAIISVEDNPIRITLDGDDPDNVTKNGLRLGVGTIIEITGVRDLTNLKFTRAESSSASLSVNYQQRD